MTAEQLARHIVDLPAATGRVLAAVYLLGTADMDRLSAMTGLQHRILRNHLQILVNRALVNCQREKRQPRLCVVDNHANHKPINPIIPTVSTEELIRRQLDQVHQLAGRTAPVPPPAAEPDQAPEPDGLASKLMTTLHRHPVLAVAWRLEHSQAILRMNPDKHATIVYEAERFVAYLTRCADKAPATGKKRGAAKWLADPHTNWVHNFHGHLNPRGGRAGARQGQLPALNLHTPAQPPASDNGFYSLPREQLARLRNLAEADLRRLGLPVNAAAIDQRARTLHNKEHQP